MKKEKQVRHIPGAFSDKAINFTDEAVVHCDVPLVKKLLQMTKIFYGDRYLCTVSGTNLVS